MSIFISTWLSFILLVSFSEELDLNHFLLLSVLTFYFTYFYNQINPKILSKKIVLLLFSIQSTMMWYVGFIYNDFLCLNPMPHEMFLNLFVLYFFITIYFISKLFYAIKFYLNILTNCCLLYTTKN